MRALLSYTFMLALEMGLGNVLAAAAVWNHELRTIEFLELQTQQHQVVTQAHKVIKLPQFTSHIHVASLLATYS